MITVSYNIPAVTLHESNPKNIVLFKKKQKTKNSYHLERRLEDYISHI